MLRELVYAQSFCVSVESDSDSKLLNPYTWLRRILKVVLLFDKCFYSQIGSGIFEIDS